MQRSGNRLERLRDTRARPSDEIVRHDLHAAVLHRRKPLRLWGAVERLECDVRLRGREIDIRIGATQASDREWTKACVIAGDVRPVGALDQIPEQRAVGDCDEESAIDERRDWLNALETTFCLCDRLLDRAGELTRLDRLADQEAELERGTLDVGDRTRGLHVDRGSGATLDLGQLDWIGVRSDDNEVGLEPDDTVDVDPSRWLDNLRRVSPGRETNAGRRSDETVSDSKGVDQLSGAWIERHDALWLSFDGCGLFAGALDGDRIRLRQSAGWLGALPATSGGDADREHKEGKEESAHVLSIQPSPSLPMKHFTLEEATETLEAVRPLAERMVAVKRELGESTAELDELRHAIGGNGGVDPGRLESAAERTNARSAELTECVRQIHDLGALVKDLESGLVDFPARLPVTGETVLLCWRLGEDGIAFWHGLDEGFAGRKPLPF
jgi:hypothetical protein